VSLIVTTLGNTLVAICSTEGLTVDAFWHTEGRPIAFDAGPEGEQTTAHRRAENAACEATQN